MCESATSYRTIVSVHTCFLAEGEMEDSARISNPPWRCATDLPPIPLSSRGGIVAPRSLKMVLTPMQTGIAIIFWWNEEVISHDPRTWLPQIQPSVLFSWIITGVNLVFQDPRPGVTADVPGVSGALALAHAHSMFILHPHPPSAPLSRVSPAHPPSLSGPLPRPPR